MAAKITQEQIDRIVELRLQGVSVRRTAELVGVHRTTADARYQAWLKETAEERQKQLLLVREERLAVHSRRAQRARERQELEITEVDVKGDTHVVTMDARGLAGLMTEEARAEQQIDKLLGLEKLIIEATVDVSQHAPVLQRIVVRGLELAGVNDETRKAVLSGIAAAAREVDGEA